MGIGFNVIGRKIGEEIEKFVKLIFEARKDDNRNALLYNSAGEDSVPLDDERLLLVKVDGTGKYVAVAVLTQSQGAKPGEKIFFARDPDGAIVSKISMLNDGSILTEADGDISQDIKGDKNEKIGGDKKEEISGDKIEEIDGDKKEKAKGKFFIGNDAQNAAKVLIGIIDEIINLETFGPPPKHKVMPTSVTKLEAYKEQIKALYLEGA